MTDPHLHLGEPADEADWRALVEKGLRGAPWSRLVSETGDGIAIEPLYREPDIHTASDISGLPGAAPFIRGAGEGGWRIRQAYEHPDPAHTNDEILADLEGGVAAIELAIDPAGERGVAITNGHDLDVALNGVMLEAAPISLDAGVRGGWAADLVAAKLKGVAIAGTAFNLDPIGTLAREGVMDAADLEQAARFAARTRAELPNATAIRVDARPVHEAGGAEAQEIAVAVCSGIAYLRALTNMGLSAADANASLAFAVAAGPDTMIEAAKLRALRLCWARVLEASGAEPAQRASRIHAFTSRRIMARYDAWTNILRVTTAAFGAAIGGADEITTYPLTDALGLPTPFARRVARNTQHVLIEECRLGHVADPAGGSWFVEALTRELAAKAWQLMQEIEARGGIVASLQAGHLQALVGAARDARAKRIASRRETITGVTDYPLLDAKAPEFIAKRTEAFAPAALLGRIRWAAPFEALRDRADVASPRAAVFFANLGALAEFGPRAAWARNLLAAGGVAAVGDEEEHTGMEALVDAFRQSRARVAIITGSDASYGQHAENCAQRLKAAGGDWVLMAGKPSDTETKWRAAGVDQFVFAGQDALAELETLHAALGLGG